MLTPDLSGVAITLSFRSVLARAGLSMPKDNKNETRHVAI